ncbi:hypothetical protein [Reticulibacter mediterranei]|uniref:hypothetical protein n=1 Tax=Reticulibacter mediterranei TaxID=2778369 RepID=UPI001C693292|nr:hypothetical protein [Reticulibacter mediterranei]
MPKARPEYLRQANERYALVVTYLQGETRYTSEASAKPLEVEGSTPQKPRRTRRVGEPAPKRYAVGKAAPS